jgi:WhiB family redox-sensing transcriptional regulator
VTPHEGAAWRYRHGCRCPDCTEAHTEYRRQYEANRRETRGSMRAEDIKLRLLADDSVEWMEKGACRNPELGNVKQRIDTFFVDQHISSTDAYTAARRICNGCPVTDQCLEYAFRHGLRDGVWGGMSPRQRIAEARRRRLVVAS